MSKVLKLRGIVFIVIYNVFSFSYLILVLVNIFSLFRMPRKREISLSLREKVALLCELGKSYREIGRELCIGFSNVRYIVKKKEKTGTVENRPRKGRPPKLTYRENRQVVRKALKTPRGSAKTITEELATTTGKVVTPQTIRNVLHKAGIKGRRPQEKPLLCKANRLKRKFAKVYKDRPLSFWGKSHIF